MTRKIQWTVVDVDDPTNDASDFHREWGFYVDVNDYDAAGNPIGAHQNDNPGAYSPGNADESKLFGAGVSGTARWAQATGGPAPAPSSSSSAQSPITLVDPKTATSSVRIHCPNVLGTNMVVKIELTGTPAGIPVFNAATGVMTMWSRIDVEVTRMAGAFTLGGALPQIPPFFRPICVQLDFQNEKIVSGVALDKENMAASGDLEDTATAAWVNDGAVFSHGGKGGWFFLGGARVASPLPAGASPQPMYDSTSYTLGTTGKEAWVEVPSLLWLATPALARFSWLDGAGKEQVAMFFVERRELSLSTSVKIFLSGNDVTPLFTGYDADGSIDHAYKSIRLYFPQHELLPGAASLSAGGFGVPSAGLT